MDRRSILSRVFKPSPYSQGAAKFTNAVLRTQDNKEVRFYDDLIKGKQAVINLMYADCHGACPLVTTVMKRTYRDLKDRMGKDLFFYSISVKPQDDTPAALKHYAEMRKADLPGWYFLTGDAYDIETIRYRLFNMGHVGVDTDFAMHSGTFRIVNDATNYWGHAQAFASQQNILQRIAWADPYKTHAEWSVYARNLQAKIDKDVKKYGFRQGF
ncbi:MAG TPA: SCO family protein [Pyrinomonadaceae bacterium]|nr:SCO family protein [Pyrinomonadaceae bacterium]